MKIPIYFFFQSLRAPTVRARMEPAVIMLVIRTRAPVPPDGLERIATKVI